MKRNRNQPAIEGGIETVPIPDGIEVVPAEKQRGIPTIQVALDKNGKEVLLPEEKAARLPILSICGLRGIKLWVCLGVAILVCIVLIAGLPAVLSHRKSHSANSGSNPTNSTTPTATLTAPPLSTGTYTLSEQSLENASSDCLVGSIRSAWGCQSVGNFQIVISGRGAAGSTKIKLNGAAGNKNGSINYGPQAPELGGSNGQETSVTTDNSSALLGLAWWASSTYDKVVVLPENDISDPPGSRHRRAVDSEANGTKQRGLSVRHSLQPETDPGNRLLRRATIAERGDSPWYCFWNSTRIDVFIYATQNISSLWVTNSTHPYPNIVKVVEQRPLSNAISPYCQQYQVLNDGTISPVMDDNGHIIIQNLTGAEGAPNGCSCEWIDE